MTRTEEIRRQLAEDIVRGRLAPGTPLEEVELAKTFGVSRTPVREAIRQLEAEGFAQPRPRRGAVVASIQPDRLAEMFFVMAELEAACVKLAAQEITKAELTTLDDVHDACRQAVEAGDVEGYRMANERFHDLLYGASRNNFLSEMTQGVRRRVAPFRRVQFYTYGRLERSYAEHDEVVRAIKAGDGERAARAMRDHILTVEWTYETAYGIEPVRKAAALRMTVADPT